jgi:hypothetical protein
MRLRGISAIQQTLKSHDFGYKNAVGIHPALEY